MLLYMLLMEFDMGSCELHQVLNRHRVLRLRPRTRFLILTVFIRNRGPSTCYDFVSLRTVFGNFYL